MHDGRDLWLKVIKERSEKQELEGVYLGKEAGDLTPAGAFGGLLQSSGKSTTGKPLWLSLAVRLRQRKRSKWQP
jgi:hypothetical protein